MKILKYLFIFIYFLPGFLLGADEPIASLEMRLQTASGEEKMEVLIALTQHYWNSSPEKSIKYGKQALKLAEQTNNEFEKAKALNNIGIAYQHSAKYDKALEYFQTSLEIFKKLQVNQKAIASSLLYIGIVHWRLGNYDKALNACLKSLRISESINDQKGVANALHNIGIVYDFLTHYDLALKNHFNALKIRKKIGDQEGIADSFNNIGIIYYFTNDYKKALEYYLKSSDIREALGDKKGMAKNFNNVGAVYQELGDNNKALEYYFKALKTWKETGDQYEIANVSNNIGKVYQAMQFYEQAFLYLEKGLEIAQAINSQALIRENYEFYSDLYAAKGNFQRSLEYCKQASKVKDRIYKKESNEAIADMRTKYETEKLKKENEIQQLELDRQKLFTFSLFGGFFFVFVLAFIMYLLYSLKKKANARLELEKAKSDKLLLNILPVRVANDLKEKGKSEPESFENVTVYFSDIVGFTNLASQLEPKILIAELNDIFTVFDSIIEKNNCERIKTIGDAYFCVCGMPEENPHHAENIVQSAIEIIAFLKKRNRTSPLSWKIRIGIHTGKVVGGVVGVKKYIYDVFGDTINTAARMESNSEPMKINVSETTYQIIKDKFNVIERGTLPVKGKGEMKMYFVDDIYINSQILSL